jgi:hypothetical protein
MQALKSKTREGRGGNNLHNPDIEIASDHSGLSSIAPAALVIVRD